MSENASDPLQDHIDSIFREFRKNVLINDDALAEMEATQQIIDIIHHRERIARLDELKYLLSLGEELYFPYGRSDKVISDRLAELNKEEHE